MDLFCGAAPAFDQRVKAPWAGTLCRYVKIDKAEQDRGYPLVLQRPATIRPKVKLPVSNRHHSRENKRNRSREEAEQEQYAAKEFKDAADSGLTRQTYFRAAGHAAEPTEENQPTCLHKQETAYYAKEKISDFFGELHSYYGTHASGVLPAKTDRRDFMEHAGGVRTGTLLRRRFRHPLHLCQSLFEISADHFVHVHKQAERFTDEVVVA